MLARTMTTIYRRPSNADNEKGMSVDLIHLVAWLLFGGGLFLIYLFAKAAQSHEADAVNETKEGH